MPFMQRLTWDGIALHAGDLPGYPASHGCIRLPLAFARLLYAETRLGLTVVITDEATVPEVAPSPIELEPAQAGTPGEPNEYSWQPEKSPTGPVSIVVSGRDRRIIVLRNGIEIGSADVVIDGPVETTKAFTLGAIVEGEVHWLSLRLPGDPTDASAELTIEQRARLHMPEAFRQRLLEILGPGATLLVTRETLHSSGTGRSLTVIVAEAE